MIAPFHGYTCQRCWLRSYRPRDVEERWCSYCRLFADELDGRSPQLWRVRSDGQVVACTAAELGDWTSTGRRAVASTTVELSNQNMAALTTTFRCIDLGGGGSSPMLFETTLMADVTAAVFDEFTRRYATWAEAAAGHDAVCGRLKVWKARG